MLQSKLTSPNFKTTVDEASSSATVLSPINDLSMNILANTDYGFEFWIPFTSVALTTGIALAIGCPAAPVYITYDIAIPVAVDGTAAMFWGTGTAPDDTVVGTGVPLANTVHLAVIRGILRNGVNPGALVPKFRSKVAASAVTVKQGAVAWLWYV